MSMQIEKAKQKETQHHQNDCDSNSLHNTVIGNSCTNTSLLDVSFKLKNYVR